MTPQRRLILGSIVFAVIWTVGMYIWSAPGLPGAIALVVAGAIAGTLWFFAMRWYLNKFVAKKW
jgi:hypothetical protein